MFIHWFGAAAPHNMNYKHHTHTQCPWYFSISVSSDPFVQKCTESSEVYFWLTSTLKSVRHCRWNTHTHTHPRLGNTFVIKPSPDDAKWHAALSVSQSSDNKQKPHSWLTVDNLQDQAYFFVMKIISPLLTVHCPELSFKTCFHNSKAPALPSFWQKHYNKKKAIRECNLWKKRKIMTVKSQQYTKASSFVGLKITAWSLKEQCQQVLHHKSWNSASQENGNR